MKVGFATTDGTNVNEHFGRAAKFAIYEFTRENYTDLGLRVFDGGSRDSAVEETRGLGAVHDAAVESKVEKLADCAIVYITAIGGPSAARLSRRGIMPVKVAEGTSIRESAEKLLETIKQSPPLWLRKKIEG